MTCRRDGGDRGCAERAEHLSTNLWAS